MNITETISLLDELRGKTKQEGKDWTVLSHFREGDGEIVFDGIFSVDDEGADGLVIEGQNAEYIVALHNLLPALRRAAMAGEALKERIKNASCPCCVKCYSDSFAEWRDDALTYWDICSRSAIEEKNV